MTHTTNEKEFGLGELIDDDVGNVDNTPTIDDVEVEDIEHNDTLNLTSYDPIYHEHDGTQAALLTKERCAECKKLVPNAAMIDGLCLSCAERKMRQLEEHLVRFKAIKEPHKYCCIASHGLLPKHNKDHPDWNGEIVVNGVHLYPVAPLCQSCLDVMTTWLVRFFEERGFLRKGSGHIDNKFGVPYKTPVPVIQREESLRRLADFMSAAQVYVLNKEDSIHTLYDDLKKCRKSILAIEEAEKKKKKAKEEEEVKDG